MAPLPQAAYEKGSVVHGTPRADLIVWRRGIKTMIGGKGCDVIIGGPAATTNYAATGAQTASSVTDFSAKAATTRRASPTRS